MPLMNCKIHLELNWAEDCFLSSSGDSAKFKITDVKKFKITYAKLHVPIVTFFTKDNINLTKTIK